MGGWYILTIEADYPYDRALESDDVADTLNYAEMLEVAKREMAVPSQLLEHVAGRIGKSLFCYLLLQGILKCMMKHLFR